MTKKAIRQQPQASLAKPTVAILGSGNLGRVLALALHAAGYRVTEIISRDLKSSRNRAAALARRVGARARVLGAAPFEADILWICVPDDAIAGTARALGAIPHCNWRGKIVLHSSGALPAAELNPLKRRGASIGSLHPMNTFVVTSKPVLAGIPFAVEGDARAMRVARSIVGQVGGEIFSIGGDHQAKALYHAVGSLTSPLLVSLLFTAESVALEAGISRPRNLMRKILLQTVENYLRSGADAAFSGPIRRGDVATVRKHLAALQRLPRAREIYLALARNAVENLPTQKRSEWKRALK